MAVNNTHYAVVVGIDDYPDFNGLRGAKNDARAFTTWLKNDQTGGGVPDGNLELVLSTPAPVQPIQDDIDDALKRIFDLAKGKSAQRLYIYFSGHGVSHTAFSTNLCLAKWSRRRTGAALDSLNYLECAKEMGVFKEVVFFMDCCRTRTRGRNALNYQFPPISPGDDASSSRTFVGYATEFMLAAHEAAVTTEDQLPEHNEEREVRGHFTRALIEALEGNAAQPTGGVTAEGLKKYLDTRTIEIAQEANHKQKPEVQNGLNSDAVALFGSALPPVAPAGELSVRVHFGANRSGAMRFEDGALNAIKEGDASTGPWELFGLKPGNYAVLDVSKDEFLAVRVRGNEAEVVDVQFD